jgi:hypothetical protein
MSRFKNTARKQIDVPPAIAHFLTTGRHDHTLEGSWQLWEALYAPLGSSRAEQAAWDVEKALEPFKSALKAEGVRLFEDVEMDGDN